MVEIKESIIDTCDYCLVATEVCYIGEYRICRNCSHYTIEAMGLQDEIDEDELWGD